MKNFTVLIVLFLAIGLFSCEKQETKNPPVAVIAISPASGPFTTTFTFNGEGSTDESGSSASLQVRWDFDGDGIFDTQFSTTKVVDHKYDGPDNYTVGLEVMNPEGWTDYKEQNLVVYADSVPPIPSFYIEPDSSSVATIFLFNAAGSSDLYTPQDELQYRWDWQNDGTWDTPFMTDSTFYYKYANTGIYRVMLEVKNNFSITDTTSRKIYVYEL